MKRSNLSFLSCDICPARCKNERNLQRHKRDQHQLRQLPSIISSEQRRSIVPLIDDAGAAPIAEPIHDDLPDDHQMGAVDIHAENHIMEQPANGGELHDIESIIAHRIGIDWQHHRFLTKWLGFPMSRATWEPSEHFMGDMAKLILRRYCEDVGLMAPDRGLFPNGNPLAEMEKEWQNFGQDVDQLHPCGSCKRSCCFCHSDSDKLQQCKCTHEINGTESPQPHWGCLFRTLLCWQKLLPRREGLIDEYAESYHRLQSRSCEQRGPYTQRCFQESLKDGCFRVSIVNSVGKPTHAYYRSLPHMISAAFESPNFLQDMVPLPARFANPNADTLRPAKYHFFRDFTQPCWRSCDGPGAITYWVNQLVWLVHKQQCVRVCQFVKDADIACAEGGRQLSTAPVKVIVECNSFSCDNHIIKRRTADMPPVVLEWICMEIISELAGNM